MIDSSTTAMIGQIQICFFRNTPVREIERPTLDVAQVMCGPAGRTADSAICERWTTDSSTACPRKTRPETAAIGQNLPV